MEEQSWRSSHGGAIMEQQSWRSNHGGEIMEEKSWRRTHVEGVVEGIWRQRHPGGLQEAPRRLPGGAQEAPRRHPGGAQRHPEGTQRHPGGSQGAKGIFETKCNKTVKIDSKNEASDHFRLDGSDVTITVPAACAQKLANVNVESGRTQNTDSQDTPPEPIQLKPMCMC